MRPLRRARSVIFDCDSTLTRIEGIEHLASGNRAEVERLTELAMRGAVPLEEVYGRRLELVRPDRRTLELLADAYREALVPDAAAVVRTLLDEGIAVRIISGGLRPAVAALARELGLDDAAVAAVGVEFANDGSWSGWETTSPLARSGGKAEVIAGWHTLPRPVILVGDGATDLEAFDAVDMFVAYAGVVARETVMAGADVVLRDASLAPVLPLALSREPAGTEARLLYREGLRLLDPATRIHLLSERGVPA
jgi:phosphoserine phosphatase